jgi:transcriptional regulator with XRE-family HTH domain
MNIGLNIRKIREEKGLTQQQMADMLNTHRSNYSKIENNQRDISVVALNKIAEYFGMTIDQIVNFEGDVPKEIVVKDKSFIEKVKLIEELEEKEQNVIFTMIDAFLTKRKFKEFFKKNVASL